MLILCANIAIFIFIDVTILKGILTRLIFGNVIDFAIKSIDHVKEIDKQINMTSDDYMFENLKEVMNKSKQIEDIKVYMMDLDYEFEDKSKVYPLTLFNKIDKMKESSFGQLAIAYEDEIYQLVSTLSSHRQDGVIEILPENIESFLKTISSIYDILCHKEKEVQAEEERERLEWVKFGEEASNKVNRTMELIKKDIKAESRVDLKKKDDSGLMLTHYGEVIVENSFNKLDATVLNAGGVVFDGIDTYSSISAGTLVEIKCIFDEDKSIVSTYKTFKTIDDSHIFRESLDVLKWESNRYRELFEKCNLTTIGKYDEWSNTSARQYAGNDGEAGLMKKLSKKIHKIDSNDWNIDPDDLTTISSCVH